MLLSGSIQNLWSVWDGALQGEQSWSNQNPRKWNAL